MFGEEPMSLGHRGDAGQEEKSEAQTRAMEVHWNDLPRGWHAGVCLPLNLSMTVLFYSFILFVLKNWVQIIATIFVANVFLGLCFLFCFIMPKSSRLYDLF